MNRAEHDTPLLQALNLWKEITGIDPDAKSMMMSEWRLRETFDELQEAIDLDPTEVTANLLLDYFVKSYLENRSFTLLDLLGDPQAIAKKLAKPRELLAIVNRPEIAQAREDFIAGLRTALTSYDAADRQDVQELLAKHDDLAILRRDALRSVARLRVDQFLDGNCEPDDFRPVYNRTVHQWWNVNSMLAASTRMPSGVALNLIRHPDAFQSYFCFTIRNGGNLFVLTDVPEHSHPLQGFMSRKPERALSKRAGQNWFPYDLLGLEYTEDGKSMYLKASEQRGLVAFQNAALPLKPLSALGPEELVWTSMMFDLIVDKFWRRGYKAPALSYTAEMLKSETVLLEHAKTANLPVPLYQPMGLPALTKADIAGDASTEEEIGKKYHEPNKWLEERYADRVSDEVLNLLGAPEQVYALEHDTGKVTRVDKPGFHELTDWQQKDVLAGRKQLEKMDATSFGSREQIAADRKFIARVNFAKQINVFAHEEYEARKDEVLAWYRARVEANKDTILSWCGNTELWVDDGVHSGFSSYGGGVGPSRRVDIENEERMHRDQISHRCFLKRYDLAEVERDYYLMAGVTLGQLDKGRPLCVLNGTKSSYWTMIFPANPEELALVAGCKQEELPDVLQHWTLLKPYTGNQILNRVDPMIWRVENPWQKLRLSVRLGFSKRGLAAIEKLPKERPALSKLISTP